MEGVVDWVIRDLYSKIGGIDACVTEFIRVTDRLLPEGEFYKYTPELRSEGARKSHTQIGTPVLVQLLGGQPPALAENAARAAALGAHGIDLNFGCPAKTVNRHDGGASLLKNPQRVFDVVKAVRNSTPGAKTVSAKIRLGFSDKSQFLEIAKAAEEGGASWLTVHARTRDEGYRPPAHWEYIAQIRETLQIPVVANGDIWTLEDFIRCQEVSGCSSFMMGRGLMSDPFLALKIKFYLQHKELSANQPWSDVEAWLKPFFEQSRDFRSPHYAVCRLKQWTRALARTYPEAQHFFSQIKLLEDSGEIEKILKELPFSERTPRPSLFASPERQKFFENKSTHGLDLADSATTQKPQGLDATRSL
jgi:tRNA-dihydrouridine synthase C